jgi:hypothetical protein
MNYYFCLLSAEEAKDPTKYGYNFALTKESDWIQSNDAENYLTGVIKGVDFFIKDGITYSFHKRFLDLDNKRIVVLALESTSGCDVKKF